MARLALKHLTFVGRSVEPASVSFAGHVTVIHGPSDTGKSFIADSIDYMLGAKTLKQINELSGYSTALMGIELPDGETVTLSRAVSGGDFAVYRGDLRTLPTAPPERALSAKHSSKNADNLSRFLLNQLDLDERRIRTNRQNATNPLSFRNLAHLCIISETQMQSPIPPGLTGNPTSKTAELSTLKLLLEGEDDSALVAVESKSERSKVSSAKVEVVDRLLADVEHELQQKPDLQQLRDQLARVNETIEAFSGEVGGMVAARRELTRDLRRVRLRADSTRDAIGDTLAVRARFELLAAQYESDLARLAMIREAGSLLGFFQSGACVFCGAQPEHQLHNQDCEEGSTSFGAAVDVEERKTRALRSDLLSTLADLERQLAELTARAQAADLTAIDIEERVQRLDHNLRPMDGTLDEYLGHRSDIEKSIALYDQASKLEGMKQEIAADSGAAAPAPEGVSLARVREFSAELARRLGDWNFPDAATVRYDRKEQDIVAGDQLRSARGKGVRAVLHAAFTLGLAQYCFDRDLPHPGFVVLDSPLVTYRPPDPDTTEPPDEEVLPANLVDEFYGDIQQRFHGQVIVIENTDPPEPLSGDALDIAFTKSGLGRYGLFPPGVTGSEPEDDRA